MRNLQYDCTDRSNAITIYIIMLQVSMQLTEASCANIGGYFTNSSDISYTYSTTTPTYWLTTYATTVSSMNLCFYDSFHCPGYLYDNQCYSGRSSILSCATCNNIGGAFTTRYGCYYYSKDCRYLSVGEQCHTNRYCKLLEHCRHSLVFSFVMSVCTDI